MSSERSSFEGETTGLSSLIRYLRKPSKLIWPEQENINWCHMNIKSEIRTLNMVIQFKWPNQKLILSTNSKTRLGDIANIKHRDTQLGNNSRKITPLFQKPRNTRVYYQLYFHLMWQFLCTTQCTFLIKQMFTLPLKLYILLRCFSMKLFKLNTTIRINYSLYSNFKSSQFLTTWIGRMVSH
jgi:hypothetical protein